MPFEQEANQQLTVEPIVLDAIGIDPVRTTDGEHSVGRSVRRTDRTGAVAGLEVRLQIERSGSSRRPVRVDRLNTPILDGRIVDKQVSAEGEVSRIQP